MPNYLDPFRPDPPPVTPAPAPAPSGGPNLNPFGSPSPGVNLNPFSAPGPGVNLNPFGSSSQGSPPPELAEAMQTLQQANALLGPSQSSQPMGQPAPTAAGQLGQIRQQQFGNIDQGQQLNAQQARVDAQMGQFREDQARTQATFDAQRAQQHQEQQALQQQLAATFEKKQIEAKAASDKATQVWQNAKPADWWDSAPMGQKVATILSMALAHGFDAHQASRGIRSNLGQQANATLNNLIDGHRAKEVERIEHLRVQAMQKKAAVGEVQNWYQAETAKLDDKYRGIEKALELQARAQRSALGMDEAAISNDQVVVDRTRRALEAEQRALDSTNNWVDHQMQREIAGRKKGGGGGGKGGGQAPDPDDPYAGMTPNKAWEARKRDEELEIPNLDGSPAGRAKTVYEAKQIRKFQEGSNSMIDALERLKAFIDREGTVQVPVFEASARKERNDLITEIAGYTTVIRNTGVLNQGEFDRYKAVFQPSTWQNKEGAMANLDKTIKATQETFARKVQSQVSNKTPAGTNPGDQPPTAPATLPPARPQGQPAEPAGIPPGSTRGSYQGRPGWRSPDGKRFYPD